MAPVTSQAGRSPRDVPVVNWQRAGLRLPSYLVMAAVQIPDPREMLACTGGFSTGGFSHKLTHCQALLMSSSVNPGGRCPRDRYVYPSPAQIEESPVTLAKSKCRNT